MPKDLKLKKTFKMKTILISFTIVIKQIKSNIFTKDSSQKGGLKVLLGLLIIKENVKWDFGAVKLPSKSFNRVTVK